MRWMSGQLLPDLESRLQSVFLLLYFVFQRQHRFQFLTKRPVRPPEAPVSVSHSVLSLAQNAGFLTPVGCYTWRATGLTVYLENGGRLEHAQQMAAHESPRTTKLYDRTKDEITIGEERIQL